MDPNFEQSGYSYATLIKTLLIDETYGGANETVVDCHANWSGVEPTRLTNRLNPW